MMMLKVRPLTRPAGSRGLAALQVRPLRGLQTVRRSAALTLLNPTTERGRTAEPLRPPKAANLQRAVWRANLQARKRRTCSNSYGAI